MFSNCFVRESSRRRASRVDLIREMTSVKETSSVEMSVEFCGGYKVDTRSSEATRSADDKGESWSRFSTVGSDKRPEEL